jgi:uncharacterized protein (DUF2267 family)
MASTGLEVWDKSLQTTNIWLDEIMEEPGPDRQTAWHAPGAVLRALRDRLPIELAAHLGAQLPLILRGAYYDQWRPGAPHEPVRHLDEFLARIEENLGRGRPMNPADALAACFRTLARHVDRGQIEKLLGALPHGIRAALDEAIAA